jgi:hypothetical protein
VSAARQMREFLSLLLSCFLLTTALVAITPIHAAAMTTLTTCTDLVTQKTIILKANQNICRPLHATAIWHTQQSDGSAHSGAGYASLRTCTSKRPQFDYQLLKSKCAKHQNTNDYWRTVAPLEIPTITTASARGYDSAAFALGATTQNIDAPVAYYLITNIKTGQINKVSPNNLGELSLSNLSPLTSYTFIIAAVSVDGTSLPSSITPVITTGAVPVVVVTPAAAPLAAPAFTLSSSSETKTVNNVIAGYTVTSTGGAIASYSISPAAPAGLTFSNSTGLLSGTPTSVAVATTYTITATNASGSATRTFTLTVAAVVVYTVGSTGPGGGTIFYVAASPFACGPARATTCTYLEAAPALWFAGLEEPVRRLAQVSLETTLVNNITAPETATGTDIGWGYRNTRAIVLQGNTDTATSAAALADAHTVTVSGVLYDDWFLPSKDELNQMCKWLKGITGDNLTTLTTVCPDGFVLNSGSGATGFLTDYYWSSSEVNASTAWFQFLVNGNGYGFDKSGTLRVRPIRSF